MKFLNKPWKKVLVILTGVILAFIILVIVFISPIAKYLIEKYDEKFLGRQVTISWIYVNPFTGYAYIKGLNIYEQNKDSLFITAKSADVDFAMLKLISKTYEINEVNLNEPVIHLIQNRQQFNFSDLITRFTPKDTIKRDTIPTKFNILDIKISKGKFYYDELSIPVHYFITDLDIASPGKWWNVDSMQYKVSFKSGPGKGNIKTDAVINFATLDYSVKAVVEKFDLKIFEQYLRDLANYGSLSANLDADVSASGNFKDQLNFRAKGYVGVNDFHFGKTEGEDFASFKRVAINMIYINPRDFEYIFDTIAIVEPFFKFERYDNLDNLQRMFGVKGSNIKAAQADSSKFNLILEIADFVKVIGRNFVKSHYKANKFALYNGNIGFDDYALREKFALSAYPLNILSKDIDRNNDRLYVTLKTGIRPHGLIDVKFSAFPRDFSDFDIEYSVTELAVPDLNPYTITYTSFPFKSGTIEFKGSWDVDDNYINSNNHLVIINPQLTKRIRKKDAKWIPMPLILGVVKEPGNYIDYEIPVRGNLKDPKIVVWDIIFDILRNIFVKPPTSPYRAYVKTQENEIEKHQLFRWDMHQASVSKKQHNFLERLGEFMRKNPEANVYVQPVLFETKEKEHMLLYESKKKYYLQTHRVSMASFNEDDSIAVEKMSVKDSFFIAKLDASIPNSDMLFTLQEKCMQWVDTNMVNQKVAALNQRRMASFIDAFKDEGVAKRLKISKLKTDFPRSGFSYFKISYDGDIPKQLQKALENLDEDVDKVLVTGRGKKSPK